MGKSAFPCRSSVTYGWSVSYAATLRACRYIPAVDARKLSPSTFQSRRLHKQLRRPSSPRRRRRSRSPGRRSIGCHSRPQSTRPHTGEEERGWRYKSHPESSVKGIGCPPSFGKSSGAPSLIAARRTKQRSVSYKVAFSIKAKGRNPDLNSKSCVH